jgi:hypothetical protein
MVYYVKGEGLKFRCAVDTRFFPFDVVQLPIQLKFKEPFGLYQAHVARETTNRYDPQHHHHHHQPQEQLQQHLTPQSRSLSAVDDAVAPTMSHTVARQLFRHQSSHTRRVTDKGHHDGYRPLPVQVASNYPWKQRNAKVDPMRSSSHGRHSSNSAAVATAAAIADDEDDGGLLVKSRLVHDANKVLRAMAHPSERDLLSSPASPASLASPTGSKRGSKRGGSGGSGGGKKAHSYSAAVPSWVPSLDFVPIPGRMRLRVSNNSEGGVSTTSKIKAFYSKIKHR